MTVPQEGEAAGSALLTPLHINGLQVRRGALANPDWPRRLQHGQALAAFDPALLSPLADIKPDEQLA